MVQMEGLHLWTVTGPASDHPQILPEILAIQLLNPPVLAVVQGVLINQGWERDSEGQPASEELCAQQLAKLPVPKLCPVGFIFAWAEKEHVALMVKQVGTALGYFQGLTNTGLSAVFAIFSETWSSSSAC